MAPGAGPVHVGPGKEGACGRGSRRVPPAFTELFGAGGVFFTLREKFFSWAPAAETGNCLPCRRPEQGEHRGRARGAVCAVSLPPSRSCSALAAPSSRSGGNFSFILGSGRCGGELPAVSAAGAGGASRLCPWRGLGRVPPAFMELFGAGGVFFTLRGEIFANGEGERGTGAERHSPDACDDVTARTRSGRAAYASVAGIVSGRKKSPLSTTAGRGADRRGRMHRQRPMQRGERKFRTSQRADIRKTSVRCTLGCCGHTASCEAFCEFPGFVSPPTPGSQPQPAVKPSASVTEYMNTSITFVTTTASCEAFCELSTSINVGGLKVTTTASCEAFCEACLFLSIYFRQCKGLFSGRGARWEPKWLIFDPLSESGKGERIFSCF